MSRQMLHAGPGLLLLLVVAALTTSCDDVQRIHSLNKAVRAAEEGCFEKSRVRDCIWLCHRPTSDSQRKGCEHACDLGQRSLCPTTGVPPAISSGARTLSLTDAWTRACSGPLSVPLEISGSRHFVNVALKGAKAEETVRFHVDTGGNTPGLMLLRSVARRLGIERADQLPSELSVGEVTLPVPGGASWILIDDEGDRVFRGARKDFSMGQIGAGFLSRFTICIDPQEKRIGFVDPAAWEVDVGEKSTIPMMLSVGGPNKAAYPFVQLLFKRGDEFAGGYVALLDTGATSSMLGRQWLNWQMSHHVEWPRTEGAAGDADMLGGGWREAVLAVPDVWLSSPGRNAWQESPPDEEEMREFVKSRHELPAGRGVFVDRPTETFRAMFGRVGFSGGPHGAVANDILNQFRILIDYRRAKLWLERVEYERPASESWERVGVSIAFDAAGCPVIKQVTTTNSSATKARLNVGDVIVAIDGKDACKLYHHEISAALAGRPGDRKKLELRRGRVTRSAIVTVATLMQN